MKSRVLLINSPTDRNQFIGSDNYFPLGLLSLGTLLKRNNINVKIIDINNHFYSKEFNDELLDSYIEDELLVLMKKYRPDVIGIGAIFSGAFGNLKKIAEKIKIIFPKIPIVIGGIHATIFAKDILRKYKYIDFIIIGEGEHTFLNLILYLIGDKKSFEIYDGIAYRNNSNIIVRNKVNFITNLDTLPLINYSIIDINQYKMNTSSWYSPHDIEIGQPFPIISSRSCPEQCTFCSMKLVHGLGIRYRSSENVLNEVEQLYNKYNVRYFQFMDDNMTFNKKRTIDICNGIIKRGMKIQFDTPNGLAIKRLDNEIIDAMVQAGLIRISIAIESGSEYIRNEVMKKNLKTEKIYEVVEACAKYNHLFINSFFIIGMPEETFDTLEDTYKMIKKLPFDKYACSYATPYPGTKLFDYCKTHSLLNYNINELVDIIDFQGRSAIPHFKPHNLELEDLIKFREKAEAYLKDRRASSDLPNNYPLRYGKKIQ